MSRCGSRRGRRGGPGCRRKIVEIRLVAGVDHVDRVVDGALHHRQVDDRHRRALPGVRRSVRHVHQRLDGVPVPVQDCVGQVRRCCLRRRRRPPEQYCDKGHERDHAGERQCPHGVCSPEHVSPPLPADHEHWIIPLASGITRAVLSRRPLRAPDETHRRCGTSRAARARRRARPRARGGIEDEPAEAVLRAARDDAVDRDPRRWAACRPKRVLRDQRTDCGGRTCTGLLSSSDVCDSLSQWERLSAFVSERNRRGRGNETPDFQGLLSSRRADSNRGPLHYE